MSKPLNPFNDPYMTETISTKSFVQLFSPLLVPDTIPLFQPGNVVLKGVQGSGKSMLLNLLKPEIRIAYAEMGVEFPVSKGFSKFIGAGINLTRSGAIDFGQRAIRPELTEDLQQSPSYFGDFLNYWIVQDILESLDKLRNGAAGRTSKELGLCIDSKRLDRFACKLARHPCWSGSLNKIHNYKMLRASLRERLITYRNFLNYNASELPDEVQQTKTSIGEPVSQTAETLWSCKIVPDTVAFYVRIDQYEELSHLEDWSRDHGLYQNYRAVVNKFLGTRDPRVSYRIGSRRYAWRTEADSQMHGTSAVIEELRNYKTIDLDELLRRKENPKTWQFPQLAEDVFRRRLSTSGYDLEDKKHLLQYVFDPHLPAKKKAIILAGSAPEDVLDISPSWPKHVKNCLLTLTKRDPLSAKLGEAWVRQQLERSNPILPKGKVFPWEDIEARWWKKERVSQALFQIAARRRQKMLWAGAQDVLGLTGGNLLVFLSVCQNIWGAWLRSLPADQLNQNDDEVPRIADPYIQDEGIQQASVEWYGKIRTDPGGDGRQRFIKNLGKLLRQELVDDPQMSYPGNIGFSLSVKDLEHEKEVNSQLSDAVDYGALFDRRHTPKNRRSEDRRKWYLNPILSPYFQIPMAHTKEPMYVTVSVVRQWLVDAQVLQPTPEQQTSKSPNQGDLFPVDRID